MAKYPDGKLNDDDAGELAMGITVTEGRVMIGFAYPVRWIGLTGDQAMAMAELLIRRAREAGITQPVTITVGG